jgi:hypothetical protein
VNKFNLIIKPKLKFRKSSVKITITIPKAIVRVSRTTTIGFIIIQAKIIHGDWLNIFFELK